MATQTANSINRTQALETVAEVSTIIAQILEPERLLTEVCEVIKAHFNRYHVHIYMLDASGDYLILMGGAGELGRAMKAAGWHIPLDHPTSVVARAARSKSGVILTNVRQDSNYLANPFLPDTQSEMAIPVMLRDRVLGILDIQDLQRNAFSVDDLTVMMTLARQVAVAVRNAELYQSEQEARQTAHKVAALTANIAQQHNLNDPTTLIKSVCDQCATDFGFYQVQIYLLDESGTLLELAAGSGPVADEIVAHGVRLGLDHSIWAIALAGRTRQAVVLNDITTSTVYLANPLLPDARAELLIPIIVRDTLIGVLDVQSDQPNRFTSYDVAIITTLANQIGITIQNARLFAVTNESNQQLRHVDRIKSDFLASMSHELRTPLNSIIGYAEVLLDGIDGDLAQEAREDVVIIHASGKHLLTLINDILDLAKIEAGKMELQLDQVSLKHALQEVERAALGLLKNKPDVKLIIVPPGDVTVKADSLRLRQILDNLLSNAVKFTDQGQVTIDSHLITGDDQPMVEISVHDQGIGIAPEHREMIFDQFRQVDGSTGRRRGGTGLGLPITQSLVIMHGGTIHVDSVVGVGSTFRFTLPVWID